MRFVCLYFGMQGLLYDGVLRSGFGLTILFMALHQPHGQPLNWEMDSQYNRYIHAKLLTFYPRDLYIHKRVFGNVLLYSHKEMKSYKILE